MIERAPREISQRLSGVAGDEQLIFLHIPKAGGTTLHAIIDAQYPVEQIYTIDGTCVRESLAAFMDLPEAERSKLCVLKGHMPFGLHEYLPQPSTYITLLRDPIERAISHYYHILRTPHHTHHPTVVEQGMSLDAFMRSGVSRIPDNGQVRMLAAREDVAFGSCTTDMLETAKANLEKRFAVVGLTERFDESLVLMKRRFGWRIKAYARRNVGKNRVAKEAVPRETLRFIEELNEYDIQLYAYAEQRLDAAIHASGSDFFRDLMYFRFSNTMRNHYSSFRRRIAGS